MIETILKDHLNKYPLLKTRDIIKLCYQNEFGCEHLVEAQHTLERLKQECIELPRQPLQIEKIGNNLVRLYLGKLSEIEAYTINQLFIVTARTVQGNNEIFIKKLKQCLPYADSKQVDDYLNNGIEPVSHSDIYHNTYQPHYRLIREDLVQFFPVFLEINEKLINQTSMNIAIDGKCGSGKSTLAILLKEVYDCHLFHMDDFFLQPYQRTTERLATPGENVDHERFLNEVLMPLKNETVVHYQKFDCSQMALSSQITDIIYTPINIIEGTYSLHPDLIDYYNYRIALTISDNVQMERIIARNGEVIAEKFRDIWIPLENNYFEQLDIFNKADSVCHTDKAHKELIL